VQHSLDDYLTQSVNAGPWLTSYTLPRLLELPESTDIVLPICSFATPYASCAESGDLVLPPLYREAMDEELQQQLIQRIFECFPEYGSPDANRRRMRVVELPGELPRQEEPVDASRDHILAFSVDTAVEEHGPHLPLATDTIQSYSVLKQLVSEGAAESLELFRPLDYGQLTWGLPFGFSIDITADLLTRYVAGFASAIVQWKRPRALYVVDVHGSITHRQAIVAGLKQVRDVNWAFRWLHEPLAEFASARGDQHAGGVETACVEHVNSRLLDSSWWPGRLDDIAAGQMSFETAVELTSNLEGFTSFVDERSLNGVVGDIRNYSDLDSKLMFDRMTALARNDVQRLLGDDSAAAQEAGQSLW
jgi:creatinine amidohydrolase/Fe(II)-dependent formamide hydrolase-like protein